MTAVDVVEVAQVAQVAQALDEDEAEVVVEEVEDMTALGQHGSTRSQSLMNCTSLKLGTVHNGITALPKQVANVMVNTVDISQASVKDQAMSPSENQVASEITKDRTR